MTVGVLMEVILYVEDMNTQAAFYREKLGLRLRKVPDAEDLSTMYWLEFETGECRLVLHGGGQRRIGQDAPKIVFRVADIQAARNDLLRRGVSMDPIRSPAAGVQVSDGRDPEGNAFSIESRA
jgi:predicted enzyme related to lactoylglutathione lyase